jgi:hypothetical protein
MPGTSQSSSLHPNSSKNKKRPSYLNRYKRRQRRGSTLVHTLPAHQPGSPITAALPEAITPLAPGCTSHSPPQARFQPMARPLCPLGKCYSFRSSRDHYIIRIPSACQEGRKTGLWQPGRQSIPDRRKKSQRTFPAARRLFIRPYSPGSARNSRCLSSFPSP